MMPSAAKEMMLQEIEQEFGENPYAFISSFQGLTVSDLSDARRAISKVAKRSMVVKHALAKKVLEKRKFNEAEAFLKGSVILTFGDAEPQAISKALVKFSQDNKNFSPLGVIFEDKVHNDAFVKQLATLPSREELLTQVVVRVKSPISGLVMTLSQLVRGLAVALSEIKKQKEAQPQTA